MLDELKNIVCSMIGPLRSVCDMEQRMLVDEVTIVDESANLFKNIPEKGAEFAKEIKCFVVPKVIE
jgi:aspartyl-tRNA(Asn)/glutamyl-tRNA(Gln) amidotransferase subunit C